MENTTPQTSTLLALQVPNAKMLTDIDAHLQYSEHENKWERSGIASIYQNYADGLGWEHVFKTNHSEFLEAWYKMLLFVSNNNVDLTDVIKLI